jgi:TonB-dependent SusC/RagA subfamily outer membrane receptor
MINRKVISITGNRRLFLVPSIAFILILFPFRLSFAQDNQSDMTLFSPESQKKIHEVIYSNIMYPKEARENNITGRFFTIIRMKKGGIVEKVTVNDTDKSINVPLLSFNEIVIAGYGLKNPAATRYVKAEKTDLSLLTNEGIRVAKTLGSVKIPEWENMDMEFAISFNFTLKYPEEKTDTIKISDSSFQVNPDVLCMVDGKEVTKEQLKELSPNMIESISVLKGESATKVFGEKGKDGVIVITTKK